MTECCKSFYHYMNVPGHHYLLSNVIQLAELKLSVEEMSVLNCPRVRHLEHPLVPHRYT